MTAPTPARSAAVVSLRKPKGCTVEELRNTIREIHFLAEQISVSLETEMQYNRHVFLTLTDAIPDGILITDERGNIRVNSASALSILGLPENKVQGASISRWLPDIETIISSNARFWKTYSLALPTPDKATSRMDVIVSKMEFPDAAHAPKGPGANCVVLLRRTPLRMMTPASSHLVQSKGGPPNMGNTVYVHGIQFDKRGILIGCSESFSRLMKNSSLGRLEGKSIDSIFDESFSRMFSLSRERVDDVEIMHTHIAATPMDVRDLLAYKSSTLDPVTKALQGYSVILFDISDPFNTVIPDRVWTEYNASNNSIISTAIVEWPSNKVVHVNNEFVKEFGVSERNIVGKTLFDYLLGHRSSSKGKAHIELMEGIHRAVKAKTTWVGRIQVSLAELPNCKATSPGFEVSVYPIYFVPRGSDIEIVTHCRITVSQDVSWTVYNQ